MCLFIILGCDYYYIKIKLSRNSGAATLGAVGRQALKFGVRLYVPFFATDPHTKFQRLATNSAQGGRPRIPTQFDFNIIIITPKYYK